jgi:creatinine amidohydrolase
MGNYVLGDVVQQANADGAMRVGLYPSREDWTAARRAAGISSSSHDDLHAGELETSVLLAAHSSYVREGWQGHDHIASDRRYLNTVGRRCIYNQWRLTRCAGVRATCVYARR